MHYSDAVSWFSKEATSAIVLVLQYSPIGNILQARKAKHAQCTRPFLICQFASTQGRFRAFHSALMTAPPKRCGEAFSESAACGLSAICFIIQSQRAVQLRQLIDTFFF